MELFINDAYSSQTDLYELMGEDGMLVLYDVYIFSIADGEVYRHKHVFKGHVRDEDGFEHPNYNAQPDADRLVNQIRSKGKINTDHWVCIGNISEMNAA
jgi:hypothetical protein